MSPRVSSRCSGGVGFVGFVVVAAMALHSLPSAASAAAAASNCHLRELDLCAATAAGVKMVPVDDAEVDKYCDLAKEALTCVTTYTDACTTPVQKELIAYALNSGQKEKVDKFCTKGDDLRNSYLKHAPCLAKAQPDEKTCLVDVQVAVEKLEEVPFEDKITTACCAYARYKKCSHDVVESTCGAEAVEFGHTLIRMFSSNLIDVLCQGFDENPTCASLLPPPGTPSKGNSKSLVSKLINTYMNP